MSVQTMMWLGFAVIMTTMFILDLGVFSKKSHEIGTREALAWTLVWVSLALAFNAGIYYFMGSDKALEFFTGYLIEESLSVDNLFVFIMIFSYFHVAKVHQPKILKWGILGALAMRAVFILVGIGLIERFHWMVYIFGGLLVFTGIKMAFGKGGKVEPEKSVISATPLFLTLLVVESSDVIFAVDSIPAVLAVTRDPFIVYTSNVFAIMGLRSLYYLLANVMEMFVYLKLGISFILAFVGAKMLLADVYPIPIYFSLGVIVGVLAISIVTSITIGKKE